MGGKKKYSGVVVPMVTPFAADRSVDAGAVGRVVNHMIDGGVSGVFVLGTTGESVSIPFAEKTRLLQASAKAVGGRVMLYAGISGTCFDDCCAEAKAWAAAGAEVLVVCPPFYYPVPDAWIGQWFEKLADAVPRPLMIYNIPSTTGVSIPVDVIKTLSSHPNVAGLKDSQNDAARFDELLSTLGGRDDFVIQVGTMAQALHGLRLGADGLVPSSGNLIPETYVRLFEAAKRGDWEVAKTANEEAAELSARYQAGNTLGESIAALKRMMADAGLCSSHVRPPLYGGSL